MEERYFLQKVKLGEGAFGTVVRAVDRHTNEVVAIKQLDKKSLPSRGVKRSDIEREIAMMKACDHVNINKLYGTFEDDARIYMALEYCDGGDFGDKVKERGLTIQEGEVSEWMRQICSAIAALHHKGVCHRDIKPDNFMVSGHGAGTQLKLADFGLAVYLPTGKLLQEKCGTPAFMAPEQHGLPKNSPGYGFPVDVWAAGLTMYMVMFGGRHPFLTDKGMLDENCLLQGKLDFREGAQNGMFGFNLGQVSMRFSDAARDFCSRMVCPSASKRDKAEDCLRAAWVTSGRPPVLPNGRKEGHQQPVTNGHSSVPQPPVTARQPSPGNGVAAVPRPTALPPQTQSPAQQDRRDLFRRAQTKQFVEKPPSGGKTGILPAGTRCRYNSGRFGWVDSVILRQNGDGTFDLEHKSGATADKISPPASGAPSDAWPIGSWVMYHSTTAGTWLPAVVTAFNESTRTYNLDLRDNADVDRIRARVDRSTPDAKVGEQAGRKMQLPAAFAAEAGGGAPQPPPPSMPGPGAAHLLTPRNGFPGEQPRAERAASKERRGSKDSSEPRNAPAINRASTRAFLGGKEADRGGQPKFQGLGMHCMSPDYGLVRIDSFSPAGNTCTATVLNSAPEMRVQVQERRLHAPVGPHAWAEGTKVWYDSPSTGHHLPAVVISFNESVQKYNLDLRDNAAPDRVKPRFE